MSLQFTTALDPIAVYAAIVATIALLLCIVLWYRSRPRLSGHAIGNMKVHPDPANRSYINLTVYNRGARKTTVTALAISAYRSWWATVTRRRSEFFLVPRPLNVSLPLVIEAGDYFTGGVPQTDDLIQYSRDLRLYIEVSYVDGNKPLRLRVRPIKDSMTTKTPSGEFGDSEFPTARRPYAPASSTLANARSA